VAGSEVVTTSGGPPHAPHRVSPKDLLSSKPLIPETFYYSWVHDASGASVCS
jgi:hypothetical protein